MTDETRRTVRGAIFYENDERRIGTMVRIDRMIDGEPQFLQLHTLVGTEEYHGKARDRSITLLKWEALCTECGDEMTYKARNMTKYLKRRCPICNEEKPYDPEGWSSRPRNRYTRIMPGHVEMGEEEYALACASDEAASAAMSDIDPASLF